MLHTCESIPTYEKKCDANEDRDKCKASLGFKL